VSRQLPPEDTTPWYRQFWPWFLIALPATMVVAGLLTLFIAVEDADDLVDDDYYRDGLAINRELGRLEHARELGIDATLLIRGDTLTVALRGPVVAPELRLRMAHPMEADRDFALTLARSGPGEYRGTLPAPVAAHWHWSLEPVSAGGWRLAGDLTADDFKFPSGG